ncbi:MAG TPA: hypothetical protein VN924_31410 [Bryobacteraceae bacterium]|jgi:hypothetical protein|nr:hypothetical protein [Bryobacteraceae bacterium]
MQAANVTPDQAQAMVLHDIRAVHDIAALTWLSLAIRQGPWMIARIEPDPDSGAGTVPGGYIDGATGRFVAPPNTPPVVVKRGAWTVIEGGTEPAASTRRYDWGEPIHGSERELQPEEMYSPFVRGGVILFRPGTRPGALGFFQDVVLLFPKWSTDAATAITYARQHPSAFRDSGGGLGVKELRGILGGGNPLLTVAAFAQLSRSGNLSLTEAQDIVLRAEPQLAATLIYCLLIQGRAVEPLIERAPQPELLRWMAVGALSVDVFGPQEPAVRTAARGGLALARRRLAALGGNPDSDAYLRVLFGRVKPK